MTKAPKEIELLGPYSPYIPHPTDSKEHKEKLTRFIKNERENL